MSKNALSGRVIIITRPLHQAKALADGLRRLGGEPLLLPAIEIAPPEDDSVLRRAQETIASYDFAMFVSANAVEYALSGIRRWPTNVLVLAPGQGTAKALQAAGIPEAQIIVPLERFDSEGLLALSALQDVRGKRVVIFRGETGREHLAEVLDQRGATVTRVVCYRRCAPSPATEDLRQRLGQAKLDGIVFTAGEAVDNLERMLDKATRDRLKRIPAFVIHPRIGERASANGWQPIVTEGGDEALLDAMNIYFRENANRQ